MRTEPMPASSADEVAELRQQVDELRRMVADLHARSVAGVAPRPAGATVLPDAAGGAVSRRRLLGHIPAVVAGGLAMTAGAAALTGSPAAAAEGQPIIAGVTNDVGSTPTVLTVTGTDQPLLRLLGPDEDQESVSINGEGIAIISSSDLPVLSVHWGDRLGYGDGYLLVSGGPGERAFLQVTGIVNNHLVTSGDPAIAATATGSAAVIAHGVSGFAGIADPGKEEIPAIGLDASAEGTGAGVVASSEKGQALRASTTDTTTHLDAVVIETAGTGRAILATATNAANDRGAVTGVNHGTGAAVWGTSANPDSTFAAVVGYGSEHGRGGRFRGGAGAVTLVPTKAATHPATGEPGDLYVDNKVRLWFCRGGATWVQVA